MVKLKPIDFLRVALADGRLPANTLTAMGEQFDFVAIDLEGAALDLGCVKTYAAFGPMCWELPKKK